MWTFKNTSYVVSTFLHYHMQKDPLIPYVKKRIMKRRKKVKENDNGVYYFLEEQIVYIYKQVIGI